MFNLKGFIRVNGLTDNTVGEVSLIGELSSQSMSYAREKGFYSDSGVTGIELVSFTSVLDVASVISKTPTPDDVAFLVLRVGKWVADNCQNTAIMGLVNGSYPDYLLAIENIFTTAPYVAYAFSNLTMGELVTIDLPTLTDKSMPAWLSWTMHYVEASVTKQATIKIWFADEAFRGEYDDYEILVVPPVDNIDDLFLGYTQVKALIDAFTMPLLMQKITTVKGDYPATLEKTNMHDWVDLLDPPNIISTPWTVIIYGAAGNNNDLILATIQDYILANSIYLRPAWTDRLPDIFKTTEFIITPMWNRYGIDNLTLQAGVYSPMLCSFQDLATVLLTTADYPELFVRENVMNGIFMYKSLGFYAVGSPNNRNDLFKLTDVMNDYIAVSTDSGDFGKMATKTQQWIIFILDMLVRAESMTDVSTIPYEMTRIYRNGIMYLAGSFDDIQYLIVAKDYFTVNVPAPEDL